LYDISIALTGTTPKLNTIGESKMRQ
jgi:hypothetical protein